SRISPLEHILEMGCNDFGGGSLLAFSERFPLATIVGLDLTFSEIRDEIRERFNIHLFSGSAYQRETVERFRQTHPSSFDLVIDDCLHTADDQYQAFLFWNEILSPHGLYVIEDVHDLDGLSRRLANHTGTWDVMLGDARCEGTTCQSDSVLVGLQRHQ
ncbi:MAG: class I SAM-dependent methyltransferase, partial [Planctomycetaceae bacterium]|nr:class I SAM-dependent methyltransferase [Planctomycetaceae bacterium]